MQTNPSIKPVYNGIFLQYQSKITNKFEKSSLQHMLIPH